MQGPELGRQTPWGGPGGPEAGEGAVPQEDPDRAENPPLTSDE